jgi:hypothetical protein
LIRATEAGRAGGVPATLLIEIRQVLDELRKDLRDGAAHDAKGV